MRTRMYYSERMHYRTLSLPHRIAWRVRRWFR